MDIQAVKDEVARINRSRASLQGKVTRWEVRLYDISRSWDPDLFDKVIRANRKIRMLENQKRNLLLDLQAYNARKRAEALANLDKRKGWPIDYLTR